MQFFLGAVLAGVALTIPAPHFFQLTLVFFWLLAFSSATHDIAADGFYMLATTEREQSFFIGFRNMFYRCRQICRAGRLVDSRGRDCKERTGNFAIGLDDGVCARRPVVLSGLGIYHRFILPRPAVDRPGGKIRAAKIFRGLSQDVRRRFSRSRKSSRCCCFCCFTGWARRNC